MSPPTSDASVDVPIAPRGSATSPEASVTYLSTQEAYARWAQIYDTDGNALQALDTTEVSILLPVFLTLLPPSPSLIDLGCGTGRNTAALFSAPGARILGLDFSPEMLAIARETCTTKHTELKNEGRWLESLNFRQFAITNEAVNGIVRDRGIVWTGKMDAGETGDSGQREGEIRQADGLISTLVLEHIPLGTFLAAVAALLKPGGFALITNMHADMGRVSQAGFKDPETGERVRGESYLHETNDVVRVAREEGLQAVEINGETVRERSVALGDLDRANKPIGLRGRKWVGTNMWFGIVFRKNP